MSSKLARLGEVLARGLGVEPDRDQRARSRDEGDLATGRRERRGQLVADRRVDGRELARRGGRPDHDGTVDRRGGQDRLAEAAQRDGVAVQGTRRQQADGADEQREGGHDHRPVGATAVDHGAPETDRSDQCRLPCVIGRGVGYRWIAVVRRSGSV